MAYADGTAAATEKVQKGNGTDAILPASNDKIQLTVVVAPELLLPGDLQVKAHGAAGGFDTEYTAAIESAGADKDRGTVLEEHHTSRAGARRLCMTSCEVQQCDIIAILEG